MKPLDSVVYCDNHLLVSEKPAGYLTQPAEGGGPDLETQMKAWIQKKYQKSGRVFLHPIHRLDRLVSGLVLFARTSKALSRLNIQMREQTIYRGYEALVEGVLNEQEGDLEHYLRHDSHRAIVSRANDGKAKMAQLHFRVKERRSNQTFVLIELKTGRYHQIRAQFSAIGHPILGDTRYGASALKQEGICLHCCKLGFVHPVTKEEIYFARPSSFSAI